jgi:hypothetical protein
MVMNVNCLARQLFYGMGLTGLSYKKVTNLSVMNICSTINIVVSLTCAFVYSILLTNMIFCADYWKESARSSSPVTFVEAIVLHISFRLLC